MLNYYFMKLETFEISLKQECKSKCIKSLDGGRGY